MAQSGATVNGRPSPYGLGLVATTYRGHRSIGHGGAMAGALSQGVRFPDLGLDIVILANTDDIAPFAMARRIADAVLGLPPGPPHSAAAGARLTAAAGLYHDDATDDVLAIALKNGVPTIGGHEIEEVEPGVFQPERGICPLRLILRPDGDIDGEWFGRKRRYRPLGDHAPAVPANAAGRYGDPAVALEAEIVLEADAARLRLRSSFAVLDAVLRPVAPGLLLAQPVSEASTGIPSPGPALGRAGAAGRDCDQERPRHEPPATALQLRIERARCRRGSAPRLCLAAGPADVVGAAQHHRTARKWRASAPRHGRRYSIRATISASACVHSAWSRMGSEQGNL
ncbi:hypothetical protein [Mesorhizobium sp.]|uniref:hypothetical protein n=1 Tax=Mesorhizobium sp. TaxID=1871066 RepID=UPI000FE7A275|nr:hypothetical protein [Mesorhizobium sp.]RWP24496.1 MAG: hypothetical protein EOR02_30885 [Mesorhizobium sp.]